MYVFWMVGLSVVVPIGPTETQLTVLIHSYMHLYFRGVRLVHICGYAKIPFWLGERR